MKSAVLKRWLAKNGATFGLGKGGNLKVYLNGKESVLPTRDRKTLGTALVSAVKRQLGVYD